MRAKRGQAKVRGTVMEYAGKKTGKKVAWINVEKTKLSSTTKFGDNTKGENQAEPWLESLTKGKNTANLAS